MNLKTNIAGFEFANPLMNASGVHCQSVEELMELDNSSAGAYVTKSATSEYREGNPEPRYLNLPLGSINSMGLPNNGFEYYYDYVLNAQKNNPNKKIFMSIAGPTFEDNIKMLERLKESDFNGIVELNLSCPNVPGKPQIAYDFETTEKILNKVFSIYNKPLGIKLPPYFDFVHFDQVAKILNKFPITYVNCVNSIGNGLYIDSDKEEVVIKPKNGFGGIGGEYIKPTALANVRAFYTRLNPSIKIIGTGGIMTGKDVFEHILCGAEMVQVGTQLMKEGVGVFFRLENELIEIMREKGYTSLDEFRGKLKSIE